MVSELSKERLRKAKDKSLVDLLKKDGYEIHDTGSYYRCLSPLRIEGNGSFDINKKTGRWTDRGNNNKGDVVDFVMAYKQLSFHDAIDFLIGEQSLDVESYKPEVREKDAIEILGVELLSNTRLLDYIDSRKISREVAVKWLSQATIRFPYGKNPTREYLSLAFKNDSGGYEFRNNFLKVSSSPKNITTIKSGNDGAILLFEGNPDYLSYLTYYKLDSPPHPTIVLNSLSFLGAIIPMLQGKVVIYYGQTDRSAEKSYRRLRSEGITIIDKRYIYKDYKDFNKFLIAISTKKLHKLFA